MQAMQIYLARNNVQAGPYNLEQVNTMLTSGEVHLDDLAWHEGLDSWKPLNELTQGEYFYDPTGELKNLLANSSAKKPTVIMIDPSKKGINKKQAKNSNAKDEEQSKNNNRLTVDQLYGRQPVEQTSENESNISLDKNKQKKHPIPVQTTDQPAIAGNQLATIGSRILAIIIDQITLTMVFLPLIINSNPEELSSSSKNSYEMINTMVASTPQHITMMVAIFGLLLILIQTFLLVTKGQTIGKVVTGIRILDTNSHQVPSVTNILLLRTILVQILYGLPLVGVLFLLADFIMMTTNPQRRSLHDRMAKTYVAKAEASQLKNKDPKNTNKKINKK